MIALGFGLATVCACIEDRTGLDLTHSDHLTYQIEQIIKNNTNITIGDNWYTYQPYNYVGADGNSIELTNNGSAIDPTYDQVIAFTLQDQTDKTPYTNTFQCGDFAEMYHNHAEAAGYKCAWVSVNFEGQTGGHACNAFNTTDHGMVFIDCVNGDARINFEDDSRYKPHEIQNSGRVYDSLGIVSYHIVCW